MKPNIKNFFTLPKANAGVILDLPGPDGNPTGITLTVLGTDGDVFRRARVVRSRANVDIIALPEEEQPAAATEADIALLSELIIGWTFEEEFTPENVRELLRQAPGIRALVDTTAGERTLFFGPQS